MKHLLLSFILILCTSLCTIAETRWYHGTSYAYKYIDNGQWKPWTDWIKCDISIKIDIDDDLIVIYSKKKQIYKVVEYKGKFKDSGGGTYISYFVIDQDNDIGSIRLRVEKNGHGQLYVDFANLMWVYNLSQD